MTLAVSYTAPILQERSRDVGFVVHSVGTPSFYIIGFFSAI